MATAPSEPAVPAPIVRCAGKRATIVGTARRDRLLGQAGRDRLSGGAGRDFEKQ